MRYQGRAYNQSSEYTFVRGKDLERGVAPYSRYARALWRNNEVAEDVGHWNPLPWSGLAFDLIHCPGAAPEEVSGARLLVRRRTARAPRRERL